MTSIKQWFVGHQYWIILAVLFISFLTLRLPGLDIPYHQDEYKWPLYANPAVFAPGSVPHPPLTELIYRVGGHAIGYDNFRMIPLGFSVLNFLLVAYAGYLMFGKRGSLWISGLFTFSFYGLLASLTVDVDGAVMVFFFLSALVCYLNFKSKEYRVSKSTIFWLLGFIISIALGFLIKLSFIIPIGVFATDFFLEKGYFKNKKKILLSLGYSVVGLLSLGLLVYLSQFLFPFFRLGWSIGYWDTFIKFSHRGWFQTGIQFAKALMYLSPFLVLVPLLSTKELYKQNRIFWLFIGYGLVFYLFLFDFSIGALDRYFAFLVVPLCFIVGSVFAKESESSDGRVAIQKRDTVFILLLSSIIFGSQFLAHSVPPQHPKAEWINAITSMHWNFLFPFTGGSGPTGFYMSFFLIGITWVISFLFVLFVRTKPRFKKVILFFLLVLGILYNGVFIEEYVYGRINGSPYGLFANAKNFIIENKDITQVVVYNDIGGYEIRETGKYARRMYATPQFSAEYEKYFSTFSGHVLYIDIPRIGKDTMYMNYFNTCQVIYSDTDKNVHATIYDCRK
ncbi:MAG: hypothetical protein NTV02_01370 [Candidatus Zambryskibacteria bacterium]|nr:hypothetical protein [Candidatus Zambryskibacteria bacterium]